MSTTRCFSVSGFLFSTKPLNFHSQNSITSFFSYCTKYPGKSFKKKYLNDNLYVDHGQILNSTSFLRTPCFNHLLDLPTQMFYRPLKHNTPKLNFLSRVNSFTCNSFFSVTSTHLVILYFSCSSLQSISPKYDFEYTILIFQILLFVYCHFKKVKEANK